MRTKKKLYQLVNKQAEPQAKIEVTDPLEKRMEAIAALARSNEAIAKVIATAMVKIDITGNTFTSTDGTHGLNLEVK